MNELDAQCLEAFPEWLRRLGDDARALADTVEREELPQPARRACAVALNYLFKSVDLIPDGLEDLGFLDDAFVFRLAAARALEQSPAEVEPEEPGALARLAAEAELVRGFLGDDFARLELYFGALEPMSVRGRSVDELFRERLELSAFVTELRAWADGYRAPSLERDPKNLVKLRSFFNAKLPA